MFNELMTNITEDIITKSFRTQVLQMAEERANIGDEEEEEDDAPAETPSPNITIPAPQMRSDTFISRNDLADSLDLPKTPHPMGRPNTPIKRDHEKIGPNAPCPCGSGKKYKKCCGRFK